MSLFGWSKPKCPVGLREKAWVEMRLRWLGEQFGSERLARGEMILPTEQYFPDDFDQTPEAARGLLGRVAGFMGIPSEIVTLHVPSERSKDGAGDPHESCASGHSCGSCHCDEHHESEGPAEPGVLELTQSQIDDPIALVALLAHHLARNALDKQNLLNNDAYGEWTTDLAAIVFGLGIFTAGAAVIEMPHSTTCGSSAASDRLGRLPSRMAGYALGILGWLRGERRPAWTEYLHRDVASAFQQGLGYLERTDDCLLRSDNLHSYDRNPSLHKLVDQINEGSGSDVIVALWELARRGEAAGEAATTVAACLTDRRPAIRAEAARTLGQLGQPSETAVAPLLDALDDAVEEVRAVATYALGQLHVQPEIIVPSLVDHLEDASTIETVAWALAQFGAAAQPALPRLTAILKAQLGYCDEAIDYLVYAVRAIAPDPEAELQRVVASCEVDSQQQAEALLPESGPMPIPPGGRGWWFWADGPS